MLVINELRLIGELLDALIAKRILIEHLMLALARYPCIADKVLVYVLLALGLQAW